MDLSGVPEQYRGRFSSDGKKVDFASQGWVELPDWLAGLTDVDVLDLSNNQLTQLPDWIGNFTNLTRLNLQSNRLTELPNCLGDLTHLTELLLNDNKLTNLPESLRNLTALTGVYIWGNQLSALPEWLTGLLHLTQLWVQDNPFTIPDWIGNLTQLTGVGLHANRFTALPEWIGNLTNLTALGLTTSELTQLPDWLARLTNLSTLWLGDNRLADLPDWFGNLTNLTTLGLGYNQFTRLPDSLGTLTNLTNLSVHSNQLTQLPGWIGNLTNLTALHLSDNRLTELPSQLGNLLTDDFRLHLNGNPLADPLPELVRRGNTQLATYLRSLKDAVAQYEAKLLVVGEGNVGKSSLIAALKGDNFVAGRPTTHGIEISPILFPHPNPGLDMTLRAWDFGGQEVYRVSHQFFFSPRALYLVVWHSRHGQERDEVEGWLRRIKLRVGNEAVAMVVATHSAERVPDLDYPHLDRLFPGMLAGAFEIDSCTGDGIASLREAISERAAKLPQMGQRISPRWMTAREASLTLASSEPQIRYEKFAEIGEQSGLTDVEVNTLAKLMHDLGLVIYYDEDQGLKDVVVLNPEWLTKAISYVLEDRVTVDSGGVLDHGRLRVIWRDRKDGYPAQYHPYFLRLMEKFDISYRLDGDETHSLVPQLVPHQRPALPWQWGSAPQAGIRSLALTCRLSESAPGLIPWLTVRHHRASTGNHWRRGVFLRHPIDAYRSEALLELRRNDELALEVRAPSPDLYFNVLRDSIEDLITRRWPGLQYQLFVPCPGTAADGTPCPGQFRLGGLLRVRENGQTVSLPCMDCGDLYEISLLLTGFTVPAEPLTTVIEQMHYQIAGIATGVSGLREQAAEIAATVRRIHRVVSAEVSDCPRFFTLGRKSPSLAERAEFYRDHYQLSLWCEHPGHEHPWDAATYDLDPPKEWLVRIAPYVRLVFRTLQLVVPVATAIDVAALPSAQQADVQARLAVMQAIVADLPIGTPELGEREFADRDNGAAKLTPAEGQALRAVRQIVFENDPLRAFGDMRRVQSPAGDILWVCPAHYPEYDPGLPTLL